MLRLRNTDDVPPAHLTVRSPSDHQAHDGHTRDLAWFGYTVPFSETSEKDLPHLIPHVATMDATTTDMEETETLHQALEERGLQPGMHVLDAGYVDAGIVISSHQRHRIEVSGPVSQDNQWQAKAGQGYDLPSFAIDWQKLQATCPQGQQRVKWTPGTDQYGHPTSDIRFGLQECRHCPTRALCTARRRLRAI